MTLNWSAGVSDSATFSNEHDFICVSCSSDHNLLLIFVLYQCCAAEVSPASQTRKSTRLSPHFT